MPHAVQRKVTDRQPYLVFTVPPHFLHFIFFLPGGNYAGAQYTACISAGGEVVMIQYS